MRGNSFRYLSPRGQRTDRINPSKNIMFRPRHAYRSPITNRYRGKARGCPVFNNLNEITSEMVEQHDECLECLAKIKNRTDLYRTLVENNKPSNNVIKVSFPL